MSERGETLFVECTSRSTRAPTLNDSTALARAIATAWSEKRAKFVDERYRPGLVTLELSGQPIDRGFGQLLIQALVRTLDLDIPGGAKREISLYSSKDDTEFMASESIRRGLIGVLASCLWSREALERDIRGIALHYDQEFWVDTRAGGSIRRPQRGLLVWRGGIDASLMLAVRLSEPAIPTSTLTPSVHLV